MTFTRAPIPEVIIVEPQVFKDERGFFFESFQRERYSAGGISDLFVQDNHSKSVKHTLRGLHAQLSKPQSKLVRVLSGEIYDVMVDVRPGSPTYKKWFGIHLSADNYKQCYVPRGFAHGFCTLSDYAEVEYKVSDYYDPQDELHLLWNDPDLHIEWPIDRPLLSKKDAAGVSLKSIEHRLPSYRPSSAVK